MSDEKVFILAPSIPIEPTQESEISDTDKFQKLEEWKMAQDAVVSCKPLVEKEMVLRKECMALFFPTPIEGTNTFQLSKGWALKGIHKIERKVDEASLESVKIQMRELGVNPDALINMKPSLDISAYKSLVEINPEAAKVFDNALTIKPASPALTLVPPKDKK